MDPVLVFLILIALVIGLGAVLYNKLIALRNRYKNGYIHMG